MINFKQYKTKSNFAEQNMSQKAVFWKAEETDQ